MVHKLSVVVLGTIREVLSAPISQGLASLPPDAIIESHYFVSSEWQGILREKHSILSEKQSWLV